MVKKAVHTKMKILTKPKCIHLHELMLIKKNRASKYPRISLCVYTNFIVCLLVSQKNESDIFEENPQLNQTSGKQENKYIKDILWHVRYLQQ